MCDPVTLMSAAAAAASTVLGDLAAAGEEDALSLRNRAMRTAWDNRVRASLRPVPMSHYEHVPVGRVDPTLGIVRSWLS